MLEVEEEDGCDVIVAMVGPALLVRLRCSGLRWDGVENSRFGSQQTLLLQGMVM